MNRRQHFNQRFAMMKYFRWLALLLGSNFVCAGESAEESQYVIFLGDNGVVVLKFEIQVAGNSPQKSFEQYVDNLMKSADANGDGIVTSDEARGKYLSAREAAEARLIPQSDSTDFDATPDISPADGVISRNEFLSYFKRIGLRPFAISYQSSSPPRVPSRRPQQAVDSTEASLFTRLDTDGDGMLSADELTGALHALRKLDLDGDEMISAIELNPATNRARVRQVQMSDSAASSDVFLGLGFDESIPKQIRRLIDKYDRTRPVKSGVGGSNVTNRQLNPQELGISATAFARYDRDGDGQLNSDELRPFLVSPEPTITISINIDTAEPLKADSAMEDFRDRIRTTPDGLVNINLGTTQLNVARGTSSNPESAVAFLNPQFIAADLDGNGYLDKSEAERTFPYGVKFESLDADKNGKLYLDEASAHFQMRLDAARSRTMLLIHEQGRTLFEILDTDRDDRLSNRELQFAANKLTLWDSNGDGLLSPAEIPLQYRLTIARGSLPILGLNFAINPTNALNERTSGPIWFRKMDKNRDGEISAREFLGEITAFEKLDLNHDGFIDLNEAMQVPAQ